MLICVASSTSIKQCALSPTSLGEACSAIQACSSLQLSMQHCCLVHSIALTILVHFLHLRILKPLRSLQFARFGVSLTILLSSPKQLEKHSSIIWLLQLTLLSGGTLQTSCHRDLSLSCSTSRRHMGALLHNF